jgi:tetratricopeptide (TPR) repeat protein
MVLFASVLSESLAKKADDKMSARRNSESTAACSTSSSAASLGSLDLTEPELETPKPFFIMDWLDKVDNQALEKAQRMLQSTKNPKKTKSFTKKPAVNTFLKQSISMGNGWNAKGLQRAQAGKWEDAFRCWRNALEIRSQCLGEDHIDTANTANNIGIALGKLDQINEAVDYLERALEIRIHHFGRENSQVATTYHNLGNVYQQAGHLEKAVTCFHESKKLQEKLVGLYHVEVARCYVSMGNTYAQANQFRDAREAYCDALYVFQRSGLLHNNLEVQTVVGDIRQLDSLLLQQENA